jgi:hypothetical protein
MKLAIMINVLCIFSYLGLVVALPPSPSSTESLLKAYYGTPASITTSAVGKAVQGLTAAHGIGGFLMPEQIAIMYGVQKVQ